MQLKTDILKEAIDIVSAVTSSDEPIDLEKSSELSHPTNMPTNMLDVLLNSIGGDKMTPEDQDNSATANMLCENEMYQLLLGNDFKMKMQNIETKVYNCPLDWWKTSAHRFKKLRGLLSSTLQFLLHLPHLSASGADLQESSLSNEIGCQRRLLLLSCIAKKIGSFCTSTMWRLLRRGCIVMTIILLKNTRHFCLHLNKKRTLNQKSMLEWMRRKSGEE